MEKSKISSKTVKRSIFILAIFLVVGLLVIIKLFKLQILGYESFQKSVIDQLTVQTNVNPSRGTIYDTNGNILATNKTVWVLYICPKNIENPSLIASGLSQITGISEEKILEKAKKKGYKYQILHNSLDKTIADKIRKFIDENSLSEQIKLNSSAKRYYPYQDLASHALGFVNADGVGIYGLEKVYNNILEGTNGRYITAQNAQSGDMPFQYEEYIEDENNYNLVSTIDMYIQYQLESVLENASVEAGAQNRATGIVINPKNGEIYAMATYPSFDLNNPYELDELSKERLAEYKGDSVAYNKEYLNSLFSMWKNKAVSELYEPGSTFKIVTTSVALQENSASLLSRFNCTGSLKIDGYYRAISCHKRKGHGNINFAEALQQSCNPSMMTLAMRIGRDKFYSYFKAFGYASRTGIDLPSESYGYYHSYDDFSNVSLAVYSFGQTFKTTAIQQLCAVSCVANGGYQVTPHLLKQIIDDEGNIIYEYEEKKKEQIIDSNICSTISQILKEGVDGAGGAKNAYVAGYSVAAKTGTSEKKDKYDENGNTSYRVSSCVAYAPSEDAQVAVIIIVDEPSVGSAYGSVVAAPYVSQLLELILPYMGVEAQYSELDVEHTQVKVEDYCNLSVEDAINRLKDDCISYEIIGDGSTVISQIPKKNSEIYKKTGKIILYTTNTNFPSSTTIVPDLTNKTPEQANKELLDAKLNIKINGAMNFSVGQGAKVVSQSHLPGTVLPCGEVVTITIIFTDDKD
ncbi:MAG: PASTA domain-containing protein [Clostridia bacterium]|nr:PASTA domain-containing protein [Clostridia bacterium]